MASIDDKMDKVLERISSLYESLLRDLLGQEDRPSCYALFIPYHSWRMPPEDNAWGSMGVSFLGARLKQKLDEKAYTEPYYYTFGEFFGAVDKTRIDNEDLQAVLLEWYAYTQSDSVEMDDEVVAARLGKAIARACRQLNSEGLDENGTRFTPDFVVFTDYIEATSGMPGLADCVSEDWLADQKQRKRVGEHAEKSVL